MRFTTTNTICQTEVIHNTCILMAGLGEVSRIGDTILNPLSARVPKAWCSPPTCQ